MDCQNINDAAKMASELYREAIAVPFMSKFVVFARRREPQEAQLRVFCMTDDKMDKTLELQEHFSEVARSRDVEVSCHAGQPRGHSPAATADTPTADTPGQSPHPRSDTRHPWPTHATPWSVPTAAAPREQPPPTRIILADPRHRRPTSPSSLSFQRLPTTSSSEVFVLWVCTDLYFLLPVIREEILVSSRSVVRPSCAANCAVLHRLQEIFIANAIARFSL